MFDADVPFTDAEVDPSDPSGTATNLIGAAIGFTALMVVVLAGSDAGQYVYGRLTNAAGVESDNSGDSIDIV